MSFFSTQDDSDDEGFTVRPTFFTVDLNELAGGGSPAFDPNPQFQSQSNGSDSEVIGYDDIMRFFNIVRGAVGLANMIRGESRDETLAQAAHQANERAEREEERRREAEEQTSVAQAVALAAQAAAVVAQAEVEATQKRLKLVEELHRLAMTGETEVTRRSAAYPDDRHIGVVWHDISGGGTTYTTAWGYYYNQKLFAYDKLVLAHSSTMSELAVKILKICKYRSQECIVVRTKADEHIRNCKRRCDYSTVEEARHDFVGQVRRDTEAKNSEAGEIRELSPAYTDYIVSEMGITQVVCGMEQSRDPAEHVIDEDALLRRLNLIALLDHELTNS
ncbi:hypothetical protein H9Q70_005157 [Fusarium xylarioides]|nr:hypothetical protein H9Q70_005157 [Fusarium xylarioides]